MDNELKNERDALYDMLSLIIHKAKLVNFGNVSGAHRGTERRGVDAVFILDTCIAHGADVFEMSKHALTLEAK